jgi:hypothetical protein
MPAGDGVSKPAACARASFGGLRPGPGLPRQQRSHFAAPAARPERPGRDRRRRPLLRRPRTAGGIAQPPAERGPPAAASRLRSSRPRRAGIGAGPTEPSLARRWLVPGAPRGLPVGRVQPCCTTIRAGVPPANGSRRLPPTRRKPLARDPALTGSGPLPSLCRRPGADHFQSHPALTGHGQLPKLCRRPGTGRLPTIGPGRFERQSGTAPEPPRALTGCQA